MAAWFAAAGAGAFSAACSEEGPLAAGASRDVGDAPAAVGRFAFFAAPLRAAEFRLDCGSLGWWRFGGGGGVRRSIGCGVRPCRTGCFRCVRRGGGGGSSGTENIIRAGGSGPRGHAPGFVRSGGDQACEGSRFIGAALGRDRAPDNGPRQRRDGIGRQHRHDQPFHARAGPEKNGRALSRRPCCKHQANGSDQKTRWLPCA